MYQRQAREQRGGCLPEFELRPRKQDAAVLTPGFDGVVRTELFQRVAQFKDGHELWLGP